MFLNELFNGTPHNGVKFIPTLRVGIDPDTFLVSYSDHALNSDPDSTLGLDSNSVFNFGPGLAFDSTPRPTFNYTCHSSDVNKAGNVSQQLGRLHKIQVERPKQRSDLILTTKLPDIYQVTSVDICLDPCINYVALEIRHRRGTVTTNIAVPKFLLTIHSQTLPLNRRQRVFPNGTLVVEQTQKAEDAGTYTCQATNRQRHAARRDVDVQILVQPKILPIQAMTNLLREGMRAAISCQILEGDLPIAFRWEKNGQPITSSPYTPNGIITRRMDEYSASLVIEHITSLHSGNYTCIASNVAGSERFTVPLTVNVPPRWRVEPSDVAVAAGLDVTLHCQADGYPKPTITWRKAVGKTSGEYKELMFEGNARLLENGSLVFADVGKEAEGHYLCEARNDIGAGLSKLIFLKVNANSTIEPSEKGVAESLTHGDASPHRTHYYILTIYIPLYSVATRRHCKRRHANNPAYPAPIDVSHQ
ncbi:Down syndrome cell adhesion molecule-like protein Dscam2 [Eumeta japonica]|uniref:Down syndrome cell adhesion molecule-like protein Dscam2 n=1 Tax=Eumeta variegata TaxID=151549 RepID=A0A4C1X8X3_EUMVA|nr:Down syndrome cell adhesion molecule-like protein Dscam2 [Eumeta japonica]